MESLNKGLGSLDHLFGQIKHSLDQNDRFLIRGLSFNKNNIVGLYISRTGSVVQKYCKIAYGVIAENINTYNVLGMPDDIDEIYIPDFEIKFDDGYHLIQITKTVIGGKTDMTILTQHKSGITNTHKHSFEKTEIVGVLELTDGVFTVNIGDKSYQSIPQIEKGPVYLARIKGPDDVEEIDEDFSVPDNIKKFSRTMPQRADRAENHIPQVSSVAPDLLPKSIEYFEEKLDQQSPPEDNNTSTNLVNQVENLHDQLTEKVENFFAKYGYDVEGSWILLALFVSIVYFSYIILRKDEVIIIGQNSRVLSKGYR